MIENTRQKISKILDELDSNKKYADVLNCKVKSMDEVISIMLSSEDNEVKENDNDNTSIDNHDEKFHFDMEEISKWKSNNNNIYNVLPNWVLRSHRKFIGKFIIFGKKVVRKLLRWYIEPIVEQQNRFNGSITASINALYNNEVVTNEFIRSAIAKNSLMNSECNILKNQDNSLRLNDLEKEFAKKIEELEQRFIEKVELYSQNIETISNTFENEKRILEQENSELIQQINDLKGEILTLEEKLHNNLKNEMKLFEENSKLIQQVNDLRGEISTLKEELHNDIENEMKLLEQENSELTKQINDIKGEINKNNQKNEEKVDFIKDKMETDFDYLSYMISKLNNKKTKPVEKSDITYDDIEAEHKNNNLDCSHKGTEIDYFKFENEFRGSRNSIKRGQQEYIKFFKEKEKIIDVGCGRGEFLELLQESNISCIGVDLYGEFVDYCNYKGLNAVQGDGIEYIKTLENNSLGGIFASQVVEHLQTEQLIMLCRESYNKLKRGCYLAIETPNPTSLSIYTNAFYMDPSHVKPVHPKTLEYLLKEAGFKEIEVVYTEQSKVNYRLPLLDGENINNLSEFNDGINLLTNIIFGSQDYAIIAKK